MISASLEGRLPYMTYPEPWRGPPKQPPEFLRPAPKPVPPTSRYNGVAPPQNGSRLVQRKYPPGPAITAPVNLTQHKEDIPEEISYNPYLFAQAPHFHNFPPFTMYQHHYPLIRSPYPTAAMPPIEPYSPSTPITTATFLSPPPSASTFSPPSPKPSHSLNKRHHQMPSPMQQEVAFKVPSGKEGSLKHRILTRPEENRNLPLDLQKVSSEAPRKRLNAAALSPPRSPKKHLNNNNMVLGTFSKGCLIKLTSGELRRIEDMRTEDFVSSAQISPELRLAESTVVRIEENHSTGNVTITLSYNKRRAQVNVESAMEHPFFVFGQGWASCSPERTQQCYRLKAHRLQVGDILISLTPREQFATPSPPRSTTIMTTATSTAMTVRQLGVDSRPREHPPPLSPESLAARKRRWSAPDEICDEEQQQQLARRLRVE